MKKHIDDIFKEQFDQFEAPVSDGLWDKIQQNPGWQQHLRRQKIKNLSIYAVLAVIVISSCAVLLHQRNNADIQDFEISSTEEENLMVTAQEPVDIQPSSNKEAIAEISADETIVPTDPVPEATDTPAAQNDTETMIPAEENSSVVNPATSESSVPQNNSVSEKSSEKTANNNNNNSNNKSTPTSESNDKSNVNPGRNESPTTHPNTSENVNPNSSLFSIPNAFTPNGDGLNDIFRPVTSADIQQYQLDIFAMSGQHIFTSRSLEYGWNGEFQRGAMDSGNYIYVIKYKDNSGKEHIDKGQLLLIR